VTELSINDGGVIRPIGYAESPWQTTAEVPLGGRAAIIHVIPEYQAALKGIGENSHLWILSWFGQSDRSLLEVAPSKVNPDLPKRGVFGLRSAVRPNPIALTLVKLEKVAGCELYVNGFDGVDGTAVLDIKPYYEGDIVFSPTTPYLPPRGYQTREMGFRKQALAHHGESCLGLALGVRMALVVEEHFGQIQSPELKLTVEGDACLADVLQGLTRARLANPARFRYLSNQQCKTVRWTKSGESIVLTVRPEVDINTVIKMTQEEVFDIDRF